MGPRSARGRDDPAGEARLRALFRQGGHEQVVARANEAARAGRAADLPYEVPAALREALLAAGVEQLYGHQRAAYDLLRAGNDVVVSTGTASGKSLCYQLAVLDDFARDPQSRALLVFPTKALAQDQARKLAALKIKGAVPAIYDGDTPNDTRALLRRTATVLLTNPDMLHVGILPSHERWAEYLHHLRFVVLDEAQQLTPLEAKTVVTRMSKGSKLVMVGDPAQIDNPYVDSRSNGLVYARNRLRGQAITAHISLSKGERSALAEIGAQMM